MDKLIYNPQIYGTITDGYSAVTPNISGIFTEEKSEVSPLIMGCFTKDVHVNMNNKVCGVINSSSQNVDPKLYAVITTPDTKQTHKDDFKIDMEVKTKYYEDNDFGIRMMVERIGKTIGDDTTIVGYDTGVVPFVTYNFTEREIIQAHPFITYTLEGGVKVDNNIFVTFKDYTFGGKTTKRLYYINFFSNYMNKVVKCRLYDDTKGFPLKDVHLSVLCEDNHRRFCPLDFVDNDFDSGVRCEDNYGHQYQVCVARQENIINRYFPFGNLVIPLTTYEDLYVILAGIFGTARVKVGDDGKSLYFTPPSPRSGITKLFAIGLNIRITNMKDATITTYNNGLNRTSFGGDTHWVANTMLVKFHRNETFKIEFDNSYRNTSYAEDALIKNALVIGTSIEALPNKSDSYELLLRNHKWFLFDIKRNYLKVVDDDNQYIHYFILNYLDYPHTKHTYNYFDLQEMEYEYDKNANLL